MIRPSARIPLVLAFLTVTLLGASIARAEDTLVWISKANGSLVTLAYGPVDTTKAPLFLLSCFNGMDIAVLDVHRLDAHDRGVGVRPRCVQERRQTK